MVDVSKAVINSSKKMDLLANLYLNGMNGKNMIRLRRTYQWKQTPLGKHSVNFGID